jgi:hypothetical protein
MRREEANGARIAHRDIGLHCGGWKIKVLDSFGTKPRQQTSEAKTRLSISSS